MWTRAKLTHAMADSRRENWERILGSLRGKIKRVLEVGSYEGQSALFWHHFFNARIMCIDNWQNFADGAPCARIVEDHFDFNTHDLPIIKIKAQSTDALHALHEIFDLIYIDGDHSRLQVMIDSCLAWRLLIPGGVMIWDDYQEYRPDLVDRPTPAIDAFCAMMREEIAHTENTGQQLFVWKTKSYGGKDSRACEQGPSPLAVG